MLEEVSAYKNLGTPQYFYELANLIGNHAIGSWTIPKIQKYFFNRVIDGRSVFDGCVRLAIQIGLIEIANNETLSLCKKFEESLSEQKAFSLKFVEYLMVSITKDSLSYEIFSPKHLSYDLSNKSIKITNSAFGFKYSQFKQLLLDFGILVPVMTEINSYYIISHEYINLFQKGLMTEIKRRIVSPEHLKTILELQNQYGEEAEGFVFEYEMHRLAGKKEVVWVAKYSVSEGYDIGSFNSTESLLHDRFIEVKSYSGQVAFYWTKTEIETARIKGKSYYLYLVDRNQFHHVDYSPIIICNPLAEIFCSPDWDKEADKYYIKKI